MLKGGGGHNKFCGSFSALAWSFSHIEGGGAKLVLRGGGGGRKRFRNRDFPVFVGPSPPPPIPVISDQSLRSLPSYNVTMTFHMDLSKTFTKKWHAMSSLGNTVRYFVTA